MERLYLIFFGTLISFGLDAFPCTKYVLDFEGKVLKEKLRISWSINTGFNNCGFAKDEISKHRFIVRIENIFEELLLRDTIDQNYFVIRKELMDNTPAVMFNIEELGNSHHSNHFLIKPEQETIPQLQSKIDTLNFYLLNGYFYNASSLLDTFKKSDLLDEVKTEYKILFPDHYPMEQTYFNCYLDSNSMSLVKMPNIDGLSDFIKSINELTKNSSTRTKGFKVFAEISHDGMLSDYEVIPESDKQIFEKAAHQLTFSNHLKQLNHVVIIVGRSKNKKKFTIVNERALMDQRSPNFRTRFPYMGAIH
jgi:hypothetical protein